LGIDLGWQSQPSGLCCLAWQAESLTLLDLTCAPTHSEVLAWVDGWAPEVAVETVLESETSELTPEPAPEPAPESTPEPESTVIAVDAPTLITNPTGMRTADRLAHQHFGRYHAGCYPANLGRPFAAQTVAFGQSLAARGFVHAPAIQPQQSGRYQIEVFPHPATVNLFGLEQIIKYKKGRLAERRQGLIRYRDLILSVLPTLEPKLDLATPLAQVPTTGVALKALEDQLDSLICAYVAAHWWYWGLERNLVVGAADPAVCAIEGYIIVPKRY
jgi:predicted RNase H-like nuclease